MTACVAAVSEHLMRSTMERFSEAWARGDVDTLMSLMSEAPLYKTSSGLAFEGREAVRQGLSKICQPGKPAASPNWSFFGDKCLSYWSLELPSPDGERRSVDGVDVISFASDGRIRIKDAYRKLA
jgi:ketosteroid isomerase-like protein